MKQDMIVEEVRAVRDQIARESNYDIDALIRFLGEREKAGGATLVRLAPRRVDAPRKYHEPENEPSVA